MDMNSITIKKLRGLILFTIVILVGLWKYEIVLSILQFLLRIILPFLIGGAIAFILNVPMSFLERKLLEMARRRKNWRDHAV